MAHAYFERRNLSESFGGKIRHIWTEDTYRVVSFERLCFQVFWREHFSLLKALNNNWIATFDGFRNTLNVRNNSKTSRWFPFIKSVTSCNWFLAVTEKGFCIAICL